MTPKQKRFVEQYLIDLNATQAVFRAGYKFKTENTAAKYGCELLKQPEIADAVSEAFKQRTERTKIDQDRIVEELALIAFSDFTDFGRIVEKDVLVEDEFGNQTIMLDSEGNPVKKKYFEPVLTENLTKEQKTVIASMKRGRDGFEIKLHDKLKALEMLMKHLGMLDKTVEVKGDISVRNPLIGLSEDELKDLVNDA